MSVTIRGFNVVIKKEALELRVNGGSDAFVTRAHEYFTGIDSINADNDIVVIQFENATFLEFCVETLLHYGFDMSRDGRFADFAIVHARHGPSMPCDWLEHESVGAEGLVWLRGKPLVEPSVSTLDSTEQLDLDLLGGCWVEGPGMVPLSRGFLLNREDDYDVWLDFNTGRIIVNLPRTNSSVRAITSS